jgi:hypothetical protein
VIEPLFILLNNSLVNSSPKAFVKASLEPFVCSCILNPNSFTASSPLSEKIPSFAEAMDTLKKSSALNPASLN